MELISSYRERIIETSGTNAWNVLEQMASRYWKKKDKTKLYIIKEEKLNDYIKFLDTNANRFIKDNINEEDVTLDLPKYKNSYIQLLKRDIFGFSPVKFRIYRMFEEEEISYKNNKDLIKDMYDIRNYRYHHGLNIAEIQQKMGKNPIDVIVKFRPFLYRMILEFLGFIDELFCFSVGRLFPKEGSKRISNILKWEPDITIKLDEIKFVQEINSLEVILEKLIGTKLGGEVVDEEKIYNVNAMLSKENEEFIITFFNFPLIFLSAFDKILSKNEKYPEDITRYLRLIKCRLKQNNIRYEIEFYNTPIDYPKFNLKIRQLEIEKFIETQNRKLGLQNRKQDKKIEETSKVQFKVANINMEVNN